MNLFSRFSGLFRKSCGLQFRVLPFLSHSVVPCRALRVLYQISPISSIYSWLHPRVLSGQRFTQQRSSPLLPPTTFSLLSYLKSTEDQILLPAEHNMQPAWLKLGCNPLPPPSATHSEGRRLQNLFVWVDGPALCYLTDLGDLTFLICKLGLVIIPSPKGCGEKRDMPSA